MQSIAQPQSIPGLPRFDARPDALPAPRLCTVEEVMTRNVVTVPYDMPLQAVADVLLDCGISGAPVVDDTGRVLGLVSKTDLVRWQMDGGDGEDPSDADSEQDVEAATTAADVMTKGIVVVQAGSSLPEAAGVMARASVHRAPVVDSAGMVVGLVTSMDFVRWVAALP
ncbi:CBS domain-containing protein [Pyxidicoccus xibeiensis]|uniref:CBS domain-containing protein n=1 Tax=Pyxidicoccus xibeiensis TaxID=2906759 RepID=UPI0020A71BA4|nr:CBS domain-containing protein [Pyxidicoccus xibeiensis]MCP3138201.1 CBS domain-containing protein [Pyxidicoccus xibeiensis]